MKKEIMVFFESLLKQYKKAAISVTRFDENITITITNSGKRNHFTYFEHDDSRQIIARMRHAYNVYSN